jgi:hypothetical protein
MSDLIPIENIKNRIYLIRGRKVLLDRDLADLYNVPTSRLKRQVRRNEKRFPEDFMFVLDKDEFENWRCQFGTSNDKMGLRYPPMAFTEQGVAMLSSVLNSERAIHVNIAIVRTFVQMREMLQKDNELAARLEEIEDRLGTQEFQTLAIMDQIRNIRKRLEKPPESDKPKIGFNHSENTDKDKK